MHPYDSHTLAALRSADRAREARADRLPAVSRQPSPIVAAARHAVGMRLVSVGWRLAAGHAKARAFHQRSG